MPISTYYLYLTLKNGVIENNFRKEMEDPVKREKWKKRGRERSLLEETARKEAARKFHEN